jgi:hypothetical protein
MPIERVKLESDLVSDLHIGGDDGDILVENFGREFSVDVSKVDPVKIFGEEGGPLWLWLLPPLWWEESKKFERCRTRVTVRELVQYASSGVWTCEEIIPGDQSGDSAEWH